jgi:MFS family permease
VCAVAAQLANTDVGPARHMVSELVHGRAGWVMTVGFACWAVALGLGAVVLARARSGPEAWSVGVLMAVAAAGVVVLAVFATQTVAGELPAGVERTTAGRLHDVGSGVATLALLAAALTTAAVAWRRDRRRGVALAALVGVAVVATVVGLAIGPSVGGLRQRVLLLAAVVWQWLVVGDASVVDDDAARVGGVAVEAAGGDEADGVREHGVLEGPEGGEDGGRVGEA